MDREAELAGLMDLLADPGSAESVLVVLVGQGGVGKTALATRYLQSVRSRFPDGELYADLAAADSTPRDMSVVLDAFLRALQVPAEQIPVELAARAALFRSYTFGRRLTVLLDGAISAAQVRWLLPGEGAHLVVVASRHQLAGLRVEGAALVTVGPLSQDSAAQLFEALVGSPPGDAQERRAVGEVALLCQRLPLAIGAAAGRVVLRGAGSVREVAGELVDERRRLASLSLEEDLSVRSALDVSYRHLSPGAARTLRLAGLIPATPAGLSAEAVAAATGEEAGQAREHLDRLAVASLVEAAGAGRWRLHDLVRLFAAEKTQEDPAERAAALRRLLGHFLNRAVAADTVLVPHRWHLGPRYTGPDPPAPRFATRAQALAWLEEELPLLRALVTLAHDTGHHEEAWQLCEGLRSLFTLRKHYSAWLDTYTVGLASAQALRDPQPTAFMLLLLSIAYGNLHRDTESAQCARKALGLWRERGHALGQASSWEQLGQAARRQGDTRQAADYLERALALFHHAGRARGVAVVRVKLGQVHRAQGEVERAVACLEAARAYFATADDPYHHSRALGHLAEAQLDDGTPAVAMRTAQESVRVATQIGAQHQHARALVILGQCAAALGDRDRARRAWRDALAIYKRLSAPQEAPTARLLATLQDPAAHGDETAGGDADGQ